MAPEGSGNAEEPFTMSTEGKTISCKAAVIYAPMEKFKIEQITVAPPGRDQIRIKVLYTSICHTDMTFAHMPAMAPLLPAILGHEASGVVESVGEGVTNLFPGDYVLPCTVGQCDNKYCKSCADGRSNVCVTQQIELLAPNLPGDDINHFKNKDGKALTRYCALGTFTEYTVVHKASVVKINPKASIEKSCVLACGVATGMGAASNTAKVSRGSSVAIFGLGTVGLAVAESCRVAGASRIIGIDINPSKYEKGKVFGLTDFINPKEQEKPISQTIQELNGGGVDYSFECSGIAKLVPEAFECTQKEWGKTVVVGVPANFNDTFEIKSLSFLYGRSITGSALGGMRLADIQELVEKSVRKEFQLDPFVTHTFPFSKINEAVDVFVSGDCLRCVLHMGA